MGSIGVFLSILGNIPVEIIGPAAWKGVDLQKRKDEWLISLTKEQITELEVAALHYLSLSRDIGEITKEEFPLPNFSKHLSLLANKLIHGLGVEVLRGLPVADYSQEMSATIFCGIGAHLGSARSQNSQGHILGHVRDLGLDSKNPGVRIYQTSARQSFHTDSSDVVALLCMKDAKEGGDSLLVSVETIYNEMRKNQPDLLELLFEPIATDRRGEIPPNMQPYMTIPPLNWHHQKLTVFYQRQYINSAQRFSSAMRLSPSHVKALDYFDKVANDPNLFIKMRLRPGDMQFVYNHSQLHDRTGFLDWNEANERRHLLRLWLSLANDRPLPECFKQRYGSIEVGNRGGIVTECSKLHAPLD